MDGGLLITEITAILPSARVVTTRQICTLISNPGIARITDTMDDRGGTSSLYSGTQEEQPVAQSWAWGPRRYRLTRVTGKIPIAVDRPEVLNLHHRTRHSSHLRSPAYLINIEPTNADGFQRYCANGANGHFIDQLLQDGSNKRGVGVRLAQSGTFNRMGDRDPRALSRYVANHLNSFSLA